MHYAFTKENAKNTLYFAYITVKILSVEMDIAESNVNQLAVRKEWGEEIFCPSCESHHKFATFILYHSKIGKGAINKYGTLSGFESRNLSKPQNGRHKQRSGQHTIARQKKDKKYVISSQWRSELWEAAHWMLRTFENCAMNIAPVWGFFCPQKPICNVDYCHLVEIRWQ
jgi:hypothetical protein